MIGLSFIFACARSLSNSLRRLFLPPFGCRLCSPSVSLTCTLPRVRRPRLYRSRWRLNSHGMQSASLYNYASITCSVHALISHFKSMTRTYQASLRSDPGSLPMQVPPTGLFITGFKGSLRPPTLSCLGWNHLAAGGGGGWELTNVHGRRADVCACVSVPPCKYCVDWPHLSSGIWEWRLKEAGRIQRRGHWHISNAAGLIKTSATILLKAGRIGSDTA